MPWAWSNSSATPGLEVPPERLEARAELDRLAGRWPDHSVAAAALDRLIDAMTAVPVHRDLDGDAPDPAVLKAAWAEGRPWFWWSPPRIKDERDGVVARSHAVVSVLEQQGEPARTRCSGLRTISPERWLEGARAIVSGRPEDLAVEPKQAEAVASVLRLALLPVLAVWSAAAERLVPGLDWSRGTCPHCGSAPLLAELRGLEQFRFLRCGLCAGSWKVSRLGCAVCGELDPRQVVRISRPDHSSASLQWCGSCGERLPMVTTLRPLHPFQLLIQELFANVGVPKPRAVP